MGAIFTDTVKIKKGKTRLIAHRGLSGIELENTMPAFIAAANRDYFGIETDIRRTADGRYVVFHDEKTGRLCEKDVSVKKTRFNKLRELTLTDRDGKPRSDLKIPSFEEYLQTCRRYEKVAVTELKVSFTGSEINEILKICEKTYDMSRIIFISFEEKNLIALREISRTAQIQLLYKGKVDERLIARLTKYHFDLDIRYDQLREENIRLLHQNGIAVNCWTCDNKPAAEKLTAWGVDFITTNILQ